MASNRTEEPAMNVYEMLSVGRNFSCLSMKKLAKICISFKIFKPNLEKRKFLQFFLQKYCLFCSYFFKISFFPRKIKMTPKWHFCKGSAENRIINAH
jgi:hypothetical protein